MVHFPPPQVLESVKLKQEVTQIEEERIQVLNNVEELEQKIKDLDNQMEESVQEVGSSDGALRRADSSALFVLIEWPITPRPLGDMKAS